MPWQPGPGALLGGKYRLERALASGGMGSVWIARHTRLDAYVAVKLMGGDIGDNPTSVARFEREAKACAQLQSPHVVGVHDFGVEDGTPYMVMELLRGEDLGDRIDRVGRMTPAEAVGIAVPIGKALRVAHEAGIIHRDLKPRNIFIAQQGDDEVVKLVDFGIARETKTRLVDDRTASGIVMGSPYHMSPEQAQALPVDHRTDLWALGVVLYRLVTGFRPFDGDNVTSVLVTICTTPHPPPSEMGDLSAEIDAFFARALAKDPARRFQSAREMVDAFVMAAEGRPLSASGSSPVAALPPPEPSWPSASQPASGVAGYGAPQPGPMAHGPHHGSQPAGGLHPPTPSGSQPVPFEQRPAQAMHEASASHALRAVSTGSQPVVAQSGSRFGLVFGGVAALAALATIGFFIVEATSGPSSAASSSAASAAPSSAASAEAPPITSASGDRSAPSPPVAVTPTPSTDAAPSAAASTSAGAPGPSASVAASPAAPPQPGRAAPRPPPAAPAKPSPAPAPAGPAIDPFTGLPVAR